MGQRCTKWEDPAESQVLPVSSGHTHTHVHLHTRVQAHTVHTRTGSHTHTHQPWMCTLPYACTHPRALNEITHLLTDYQRDGNQLGQKLSGQGLSKMDPEREGSGSLPMRSGLGISKSGRGISKSGHGISKTGRHYHLPPLALSPRLPTLHTCLSQVLRFFQGWGVRTDPSSHWGAYPN